jgi:D-3-phosphoglycerate dehydrogenase
VSSKRVLLPEPIQPEAVDMLTKAGCEVVPSPDPKPETVIPLLEGIHAIILRTGIHITRDLVSHANDLGIISRTGAGFDNVDVAAASEKEIIVTSNLGVNTVSVVEHALSLILALSKRLFLMDKAVREGNFAIRRKNLPQDLSGKTLGLLGFGAIGRELGRVCHQMLHMKILAFDPYVDKVTRDGLSDWVRFVDLEPLFSNSDVLSIHVPLTEETRNKVAARELAWMKPDAILINTSRGGVIHEGALIEALSANKIAGAGLDVFSEEPLPAGSPFENLENVILTPHSAALTKQCVVRMATEAAQCVIDLLGGLVPHNVANPEVLTLERWAHLKRRDEGW